MALSNLYIFNYNTYFNRIVKREDTFADYGEPMFVMEGVNFNIADGVDTQIIWGKSTQSYHGQGNYLIDYNEDFGIQSRWFITDSNFNRQGQWVLTLRRDLLADFYNNVIEAPSIINRGMLTSTNSLIFNPEGFSFNQIKKEEILLKDASKIPWYYLYFKKQGDDDDESDFKKEGTVGIDSGIDYDITINTSISSSIYRERTASKVSDRRFTIRFFENYDANWGAVNARRCIINITDNSPHYEGYSGSNTNLIHFSNSNAGTLMDGVFANKFSTLSNLLNNQVNDYISDSDYNTIWNARNKVVKDGDNRYWRVNVSVGSSETVTNDMSGALYTECYNLMTDSSLHLANGSYRENQTEVSYVKTSISVTLSEISVATVTWKVDYTTHDNTMDGDFNILAIPAKTIRVITPNNPAYVQEDICKRVIDSIMRAFSNEVLVDIQLLPYAPYQGIFLNGNIVLNLTEASRTYFNSPINNQSLIELYVPNANFSFDINQSINMQITNSDQAMRLKMDNECSLYRLCSPNYNGIFEFSVAKNGGSVDFFNVDMTLKPYNPYIHINPNFKGLYGADFDDSRGLICGGDFSIPKWSNAFVEYELNNKNYQQIFDRQIKNMDFNYQLSMQESGFGALVGIAQGGITGAAAGGSVGGMYGAIAGGVTGTALSGIGGTFDMINQRKRYNEARSYAYDTFKYQLGNIKALPESVNKVTPFTYNNKIWPFVEIYTCTEEEQALFENYLNYMSMTVESVGTINSYINENKRQFVQATIIRIEGVDNHESEAIYDEIKKGAYF